MVARRRTKSRLKKHRNVARKLVKVNVKPRKKAQKRTGFNIAQNGTRLDGRSWRLSWKQKARTSKEWKWQKGIVTHPPSGSQWNRGHFSMKKWESEKHKN